MCEIETSSDRPDFLLPGPVGVGGVLVVEELVVVFAVKRKRKLQTGNGTKCRFLDLPLGHVLGGVALAANVIEDEAELAALLPGSDAVQADVELGAVGGIGVLGVGVGDAIGINFVVGGASKAALKSMGLSG